MREGSKNGNWKGGVCKVKVADDILSLPPLGIETIKKKLLASYRVDESTGCWLWTGGTFPGGPRLCKHRRKYTSLSSIVCYIQQQFYKRVVCFTQMRQRIMY